MRDNPQWTTTWQSSAPNTFAAIIGATQQTTFTVTFSDATQYINPVTSATWIPVPSYLTFASDDAAHIT